MQIQTNKPNDVFTKGEPPTDFRPSVLDGRSYIDDMSILARSREFLYEKVERLLAVCDR